MILTSSCSKFIRIYVCQ